ncbi:nicotianamine synthase-like [Humulus lupulus]|uniref:nicotianamine synthase-like n=1 Tax=Humulus lupulus TaxID=3486 RepID=UPI002B40FF55|nr:nicotianamine synthase-like [Humulus lupulus]
MEYEHESLVGKVSEIYENISKLDSLNPSKQVNFLFTQLVQACIPPCPIDIAKLSNRAKEMRSKLITLCGKAEGLLESHYSTLIGSYENPLDHISLFPYYSNYLKLSQLEFTMLSQNCTQVPNKVAFVGSGPLPLTSIVLASSHLKTTAFHNYDIDPMANSQACDLVSPDSDLSKRMFFHTSDIMNVSDVLKEYQVVFLAALVGMNKEDKTRVIDHLAKNMAPGAILLLRSAHGARVFLYPVIDPCDLQEFEVLSVFHPTDDVINSIIVARKKSMPIIPLNQGLFSSILPSKCSEIHGFNTLNHGNMIEELAIDEK